MVNHNLHQEETNPTDLAFIDFQDYEDVFYKVCPAFLGYFMISISLTELQKIICEQWTFGNIHLYYKRAPQLLKKYPDHGSVGKALMYT